MISRGWKAEGKQQILLFDFIVALKSNLLESLPGFYEGLGWSHIDQLQHYIIRDIE